MKRFLRTTAIGLLLLAIALVNAATPEVDPLQQIAGYQQWTRVTPNILNVLPDIDSASIGG